jgi:glutamine amidotransferase
MEGTMIAIVDYDAGNIKSVEKALQYIGEKPLVTRDLAEIQKADKVIVPGVGAFEDAMEKMSRFGLKDVLRKIANQGTPILGICLGLQLFFDSSEESPNRVEGLRLLPGEIVHFPEKEGVKIPHMGWNSITVNPKSKLLQGIPDNSYVYFVHSYYLKAKNKEDVAATTDYIVNVHAAAEHENIFATQFHPEKSGEVGLQILKNFAKI